MLVRNILDFFDARFPGGPAILDYLRRFRIDMQSLARTFKPWETMENNPPMLTLEVTNICNANCLFCAYQYQGGFRQGRGIMPEVVFEKALYEYKLMGGSSVGFTPIVGDPLLDPHIIERISKAHSLGMWTGLYTNGIRLNHIDVRKLLESGVSTLVVSTAPLKKEIYELLYRKPLYDDVLHGLRKLLIARNHFRPDLVVNIAFRSHIPMKEALSLTDFRREILPLLTRGDLRNLIVNTRGFDTWGGQIKQEDLVGMMRLALPPLIKRRPCSWTWGLTVTWEGQVRACVCRFENTADRDGKDDLYLGNIMKTSLGEIWAGPEIRRLRRRFISGDLPWLCRKCTLYRSI